MHMPQLSLTVTASHGQRLSLGAAGAEGWWSAATSVPFGPCGVGRGGMVPERDDGVLNLLCFRCLDSDFLYRTAVPS